ncbi:hypothetical protein JXL19_09300 [bacterium]|nr:hypothetical protein [bacterium]
MENLYETYVLEDNDVQVIDLGDAHQAYLDYPQIRQAFQNSVAAWKTHIDALKAKNPVSITNQEMDRADALAEEAENLKLKCLNTKEVLCHKLEGLILECKEFEGGICYLTDYCNAQDVEQATSWLQEAQDLKDGGALIEAIEKAYQSRESLAQLLAEAKNRWILKHQKRLTNAEIDSEDRMLE